MPLEKQSLNNFLPDGFETNNLEGYKENFSADKIATGYEKDVKDRVSGPNFNNLLDVIGKNTNVLTKFMDFIKNMPINNLFAVDENNQLVYKNLDEVGGGGLEIGDIGFTQMAIDETKGKRRKLNGQLIIQDQYVQLTNIIKNSVALNPDLACTESEWQTAVTMSANGVCYKFVIDNEGGTIRLPKYTDYLDLSINGAKTVSVYGNGKSLGITNGTNYGCPIDAASDFNFAPNGYDVALGTSVSGGRIGTYTAVGVTTDASKSGITGSVTTSSEKIKGTYFIQVATGAETEDNIINEIELNNPFSLLDYKYSEYELNNLSWLRSNGQYNSKAVYPAVYNLLLKEYNNPDRFATFNKDAFTVVGSPTITDDGVASGFVAGSYVRVFSDFYLKDSWEVKIAFSFSSTGLGSLFANPASHANMLFVDARRISFKFSSTGTSNTATLYSSKKLEPNKKYLARLKYDSTTGYTVDISTNGIDWENHITLANTDKMVTNPTNPNAWDLGVLANSYTILTDGSIDLKQFSITVDGNKVFSGANSKVKLSTEAFTDTDFVLNTAEETFRLPIKVKLASGKAVVGNGIALGMYAYNGDEGAVTLLSDNSVQINSEGLGRPPMTLSSQNSAYTSTMAITQNPNYSGIETSDSGLYLYFYVGETVQNANLINAGRIEEHLHSLIPDNSSIIAGYAMPSNRYVDLTLGASGSTYTAPANGWIWFETFPCTTAGYQCLKNNSNGMNLETRTTLTNTRCSVFLPVQRGDEFTALYDTQGTRKFRFYYAQGEVN